jgi:hypothetical protein
MLKKMILALLLAANGTVAFAAQQEIVKTKNQTTEQEQKETFVQKSKKALKTYFIRDTKIKTGLNIAAKTASITLILILGNLLSRTPRNDLYGSALKNKTTAFFGILPAILALRELTNY